MPCQHTNTQKAFLISTLDLIVLNLPKVYHHKRLHFPRFDSLLKELVLKGRYTTDKKKR